MSAMRDAPPVLRAEVEVVGREGIFAERHLDDGMARVFDDEVLAHVERRARVAALRCDGGEREQHVERRYEVRRQLYFGGMSEHLADKPRVYALLYREYLALGAEHVVLEAFELFSDEALRSHERLLAHVVHRRFRGRRFRYFYIVAEDLVDSGLKVLYSCAFALRFLESREPL